MASWRRRVSRALGGGILQLASVALGTSLASAPVAAQEETFPRTVAAEDGFSYRWRDSAGRALPFQDDRTILEVLASAPVVSRAPVGRGVAGAEKLVLEHDGVRLHAVLRTVERREVDTSQRSYGRRTRSYLKDSAQFEVAAYELSELLDIHRVPPVVARRIDGEQGTVQIWMEGVRAETDLVEQGVLDPPDPDHWFRQKAIMTVLDNLVANRDRNQGNLLIDEGWNLWFIDHTRAFGTSTRLLHLDELVRCERRLWHRLHEVEDGNIRARLEPYLTSKEISRLLIRRKKIVDRLTELIEERGKAAVLFDLPPPGPLKVAPGPVHD